MPKIDMGFASPIFSRDMKKQIVEIDGEFMLLDQDKGERICIHLGSDFNRIKDKIKELGYEENFKDLL